MFRAGPRNVRSSVLRLCQVENLLGYAANFGSQSELWSARPTEFSRICREFTNLCRRLGGDTSLRFANPRNGARTPQQSRRQFAEVSRTTRLVSARLVDVWARRQKGDLVLSLRNQLVSNLFIETRRHRIVSLLEQ